MAQSYVGLGVVRKLGLHKTRKNSLLRVALVLAVVAFSVWSCLPVDGQNQSNAFPHSTNTSFTSSTEFAIPSSNATISFASGGSYTNASLSGGVWNFTGLFTGGGYSALPNILGVILSVSAENCNVTITHMDALDVMPPFPGELDYTVKGTGTQTFNLHSGNPRIVNWTSDIDGEAEPQGNG